MAADRPAHLVHAREKLFDAWPGRIVYPLCGYLDTPVHDTLQFRIDGTRLIQSESKSMLDCDFSPFKRVGTFVIGELKVAFILNLEANFKFLAYIQVFIVTEIHICCEVMEKAIL